MSKYVANLPKDFRYPNDSLGRRLLADYGALFVARGGARPPPTLIFKNETEVAAFQTGIEIARAELGDFQIELQAAAMKTLKKAVAVAARSDSAITPRGADAARRDYAETVRLWASRVEPGLTHHVGAGRLKEIEAARIRRLAPFEQVSEIFRLEAAGLFFSRDLSKSIVYSVAPPGTSQHLSMLALDVEEHGESKVRDILAKHFWYQTVVSDLPHFTFLGVPESRLADLGLKKVSDGGRAFWVPSL